MIKALMILVFFEISFSHGYLIFTMRDDQYITYNFTANIDEYDGDKFFDYGLWSRYTPLSKINQVGSVGILDSNCFHLHSATEYSTQRLNFICYDCLEIETQRIKRIIEFVADDGKHYKFEKSIENLEYEFVWHYFSIIAWPGQKRVEIIFIQYPVRLFYEIINIQFPFKEENLLLKFGGGFIVNDSNDQILILETKQFSYLPGAMYLHPLSIDIQKVGLQNDQIAIQALQDSYIQNCYCIINSQLNLQDQDLSRLDHQQYVSEYTNCDTFAFSTWIKIDKIYSVEQEFLYQFIKISANFENQQLINDNLSAFQLYYMISSIQNKIIFTTYSYSFPSVLIDFTKDTFLIKKVFDINNDINSWQYLSIQLKENLISMSLTFYQQSNQYTYQTEVIVNQFHIIQYKLQYGNHFQQTENYLDVKLRQMIFTNCLETDIPLRSCHFSCKDCDGPTKNDCLSCQEESKRIYLPQSKSCICPYDLMDVQECKSYNDFQLQLQFINEKEEKCKYGYFKVSQDTCIRCPSVIQENLITCMECIENPQSWILNPYCSTNLYLDKEGNPFKYIKDDCKIYFIYDGNDLNALRSCQTENKNNIDFIYDTFLNSDLQVLNFCTNYKQKVCIPYKIDYCRVVGISLTELYCIKCFFRSETNGVCIIDMPGGGGIVTLDCLIPYYLTSDKRCELCLIEFCIYCFEYYSNELKRSTLYLDFEIFPINEYHNIGCALCNPGFIFDFTIKKCLQKQPQIENCLRSYINMEGQEICTLSSIDNFQIAPEINNCYKYIPNCKQCLLTPQQILICIICDFGYKTISVTGQCEICNIDHAQICVEVTSSPQNGWNKIIQSFTLLFLPDKYYYPFSINVVYMATVPLTCDDGYQPNISKCYKYCDPNCLQCVKIPYGFNCGKCPLNYYQLPIRVEKNGKCLTCPPLCQICEPRLTTDIQAINPYYIITQSNEIFTYKCLQTVQSPNVHVDPYLKIAQYCYNENCNYGFKFEVQYSCNPITISLFNPFFPGYYENSINKEICNRIGLQAIIIHLKYLTYNNRCFFPIPYQIQNNLKNHIFSLQQVHIIYEGYDDSQNKFDPEFYFYNFDKVEILKMNFIVPSKFILGFKNNNNSVDVRIVDTFICKLNRDVSKLAINSTGFNNFEIKNVTIININVTDSTIFDILIVSNGKDVIINHFSIINCTIINSIVFNFVNTTRSIIIKDLIIESTQFINSTYLNLNLLRQNETKVIIQNLSIKFCMFNQSIFLYSMGTYQYNIQNITLSSNVIDESNFILVNSQIQMRDLFITNNILINTQFLITNHQVEQKGNSYMEQMIINRNLFYNFNLLTSISSCQIINEINLSLNNLQFFENIRSSINQQFIFNITCQSQLRISDVIIRNSFNLTYFYLFNVQNIIVSNVTYSNEIQFQKIPSTLDCFVSNYDQYNPQLFQIQGIEYLEIRQITIVNQFSIDQSLISILTNIFFQPNIIERIEISDIYFVGNILLKKSIGNYLSSIAIYSEKRQEINLRNLIFKENFQNQYIDDPSLSSTTLIFLNSQQSNIIITNLTCQNNALTNSSSSLISIYANSISFNYISIHGNNMQNYSIWNKYYDIEVLNLEHENKINQIINTLFSIKTIGGALFLTTGNCSLINGLFSNIYAYSAGVVAIKSQGAGFVSLYNVDIRSVQTIQSQGGDSDGCISIKAQNSQLSLFLINITFNSVQNVLSSSILTIEPSLKQNYIKLQNITILNCFSLLNQLMKIEFQLSTPDFNQIFLENLMIQQDEANWLSYLQNLNPLKSIEIEKIANDNVLIELSSCHVTITKLTIAGLYISSIIKIIDSPQVFLTNIYFHKMILVNFMNMIKISQLSAIKQVIILQNILIQSLNYYDINTQNVSNLTNFVIQFQSSSQLCQQNNTHIELFTQNTLNIKSFLTQLQTTPQTNGSIFYFQSNSNQSILSISQMKIINVECKWCLNGLIYFELNDFQKINIQELFCISNNILQNGCVVAKSKSNQNNLLILKQSTFILNKGNIGTAINAKNLRFFINQCRFLNNSASQQGGAIYLQQDNDYFLFKQTLIMNNKAQDAGGLYLYGSNSLNQSNFIKSIIFLNKAGLNSNNLKAIPVSLELSINQMQMNSISIDNVTKTLILKPYKMEEQGIVIQTTQLKIPSKQKILNYKIFNFAKLEFENYIYEFSISLRNSLNEQLPNLIEYECQINQQILEKNKIVQSIFISKVTFNTDNSNFDLGSQSFSIDPYKQQDQINEILITCQTENQTQKLFYSFIVQPLKCQLGEFYVDSGCQLCEPNQGFYSVTYNATKCSIFDPSKFDQITSNLIKVKQGFWRPVFLSDNVEQCFKNQETCEGGWLVGDSLCKSGYLGGLCEECDKYNQRGYGVYFRQKKATTCNLCDSYSVSILPFITTSIWAIVSNLLTLISINKSNKLFSALKLRQKFAKIIFKYEQDHESILIKLFLNYLWIFSIIFTFNITFSFSFSFIDQTSNPSHFMANSLDCYLQLLTEYELIYVRIIAMLILMGCQILLIYIGFQLSAIIRRRKIDSSIFSITLLYLYVSNYAALITQFCSILAKRSISKIDYIQGDVSLIYGTQSHIMWMIGFVSPGLGLFGIFFPFSVFLILYFNKGQLDKIQFRKHLCYLFNEYNDNNYFWEWIKLWNKSILIFISIYFETDIFLKASLLGLCLLFYQLLASRNKPYSIEKFNTLDVQSGQICSISLFLAAVKYVSEQKSNQISSIILQIMITLLCVKLCYPFLSKILTVYVKKYQLLLLIQLYRFFNYIYKSSCFTKYLKKKLDDQKQREYMLRQNIGKLHQYFALISKNQVESQRKSLHLLLTSQTQTKF